MKVSNLLKSEFYKLVHSWYFWGIAGFNFLLSSVLLLDSTENASNLFLASLFNIPLLYFLTIVFAALFVGNDFGQRTLQTYLNAGHSRGQVLFAKMLTYQVACLGILLFPLLIHGILGSVCRNQHLQTADGNFFTILAIVFSVIAMCMLPFFLGFLFGDMGKTLAVPMVLFFLTIFILNGDQSQVISRALPMGQLRLISLQQASTRTDNILFIDCLWITVLYIGAYLKFRRSDLK